MDFTGAIIELYGVFVDLEHVLLEAINSDAVTNAYKQFALAYKQDLNWRTKDYENILDFNDLFNQFAYLHKFAKLHTGLACDVLQKIFRNSYVFYDISSRKTLNLCSLGGGPGSDVFALLFALKEAFKNLDCKITVIDHAEGWKNIFECLISKMVLSFCDHSRPLPSWHKNHEYLKADLLILPDAISPEVHEAISNADFITMIKFISAVACSRTKEMLKTIFDTMKPGAMLLFIDNAAGGFHELVVEVTRECDSLACLVGPIKHYVYTEPRLASVVQGTCGLSKARVTVHLWKKMRVSDHLDLNLFSCILQAFT